MKNDWSNPVGIDEIDVTEKAELAYWARAIQVSEEELVGIVDKVGPTLPAVMRAVILKDIRRRRFSSGS